MMTVVNNGASTLLVAHAVGDGTLQLQAGDGARFGTVFPMRVTVQDPTTHVLSIFVVGSRAGDVLTITGEDEGTIDQAFAIGALVENRWTAGAVAELPHLGTAQTFTAPQTIHARAAVGKDSGINQPSIGGGLNRPAVVLDVVERFTAAAPQYSVQVGLSAEVSAEPPDAVTYRSYTAFNAYIGCPVAADKAAQNLTAIDAQAKTTGGAPVARLNPGNFYANCGGTGHVTEMRGISVLLESDAGTTCDYATGIYVDTPGLSGGSTGLYGVYINDQSYGPAGASWNLYSDGPNSINFFGGLVGIGSNIINPAAQLDVESSTRGFLPPRMTTAQRDAIATPPDGLMVYNTTTGALNVHSAGVWKAVTAA